VNAVSDADRAAAERLEALVDEEVAAEPRRRGRVWLVYAALYAVAIPWYWPTGYRGPLVAGLPLWVAVSLLAVAALALWTARVLTSSWRDRSEAGGEAPREAGS